MDQPCARRVFPVVVAILAVVVPGSRFFADDAVDVPAVVQAPGGHPSESRRPGDTSGDAFDAAAQAAKLLAILDGSAGAGTLRARLRDRDPVVAGAALQALGARSQKEAMDAILQVIDDTTEPVRLQAFQLLLDAPDADQAVVTRALAGALKDPDWALVVRAVRELVTRDDPDSVAALMDAQRDGDVELRLLIVKSLGAGDSVRPYLFYALDDPDERVRKAAEQVLATR
jgi:HEAT repeat protein